MAPFFVDTSHERTPAAIGSLPGSSEVADFSSPITFRLLTRVRRSGRSRQFHVHWMAAGISQRTSTTFTFGMAFSFLLASLSTLSTEPIPFGIHMAGGHRLSDFSN